MNTSSHPSGAVNNHTPDTYCADTHRQRTLHTSSSFLNLQEASGSRSSSPLSGNRWRNSAAAHNMSAAVAAEGSYDPNHFTTVRPQQSQPQRRTPIGALVKNLFWTPTADSKGDERSTSSLSSHQRRPHDRPRPASSLGLGLHGMEPSSRGPERPAPSSQRVQSFQVHTAMMPPDYYNNAVLASAFETPAIAAAPLAHLFAAEAPAPPAPVVREPTPPKLDQATARLIGVRDRADLSNEDELDRVLAIENKSKKLDAKRWAAETSQAEFIIPEGLVGPYKPPGSFIEKTPPRRPPITMEDYHWKLEKKKSDGRKPVISELPMPKHPFAAKQRAHSYLDGADGQLSDHINGQAGLKSFFGDGAEMEIPELMSPRLDGPAPKAATGTDVASSRLDKESRRSRKKEKKKGRTSSTTTRTKESVDGVLSPTTMVRMESARAEALAKLEAKTSHREAAIVELNPKHNSTSTEGINGSSTQNKTAANTAKGSRQTMETIQTQSTASFGHILHANGEPLPINLQVNPLPKNGNIGIGVPPGATAPRMFPRRMSSANMPNDRGNASPLPNISERSEHTKQSMYSDNRQPSERAGPGLSAHVSTETDRDETPGRSPGLPPLPFQKQPEPSLVDLLTAAGDTFFVTQDGTIKMGQPLPALSQALAQARAVTPCAATPLAPTSSTVVPAVAQQPSTLLSRSGTQQGTNALSPPPQLPRPNATRQDSGERVATTGPGTESLANPAANDTSLGDDERSRSSASTYRASPEEWAQDVAEQQSAAYFDKYASTQAQTTTYARSDATDEATVRAFSPPQHYSQFMNQTGFPADLIHDPALHQMSGAVPGDRGSVVSQAGQTAIQVDNMLATSHFHDERLCQYLDAAKLNLIGEEAKKALIRAARARIIELRDMQGKGLPIGPHTAPLVIDKKRRQKRDGQRRVSDRSDPQSAERRATRKVSDRHGSGRKVSGKHSKPKDLEIQPRRTERSVPQPQPPHVVVGEDGDEDTGDDLDSHTGKAIVELTRLLSHLIPKDKIATSGDLRELLDVERTGRVNHLTDEMLDRIEDHLFEPLPRTPVDPVAPGVQLPPLPGIPGLNAMFSNPGAYAPAMGMPAMPSVPMGAPSAPVYNYSPDVPNSAQVPLYYNSQPMYAPQPQYAQPAQTASTQPLQSGFNPTLPGSNSQAYASRDVPATTQTRGSPSQAPLTPSEAAQSMSRMLDSSVPTDFGEDLQAGPNPTGTYIPGAIQSYTGLQLDGRFKLILNNPDPQTETSTLRHPYGDVTEGSIHTLRSDERQRSATGEMTPMQPATTHDAWVNRPTRSANSGENWGPRIDVLSPTTHVRSQHTPSTQWQPAQAATQDASPSPPDSLNHWHVSNNASFESAAPPDLNRDLPPLPDSVYSQNQTQSQNQYQPRPTSALRHSVSTQGYEEEDNGHEYITPNDVLGESDPSLMYQLDKYDNMTNSQSLSQTQPTITAEHHRHSSYSGSVNTADYVPPWDLVAQRLYSWALVWDEELFQNTLLNISLGKQLEAFPLTVFMMVTFKRNLQVRMTKTPPLACDKLFVPPNIAEAINVAVHAMLYDDAKLMLMELWKSFGFTQPPRVIISVAQHGIQKGAWLANRYDLTTHRCTSYIVTHAGMPERPNIDGRTFMWWHPIKRAWPERNIPDPNEMAQVLKPSILPKEFAEDVSLRATVIGRNLLLGIHPDHEHDRGKLREHIWEEVKRLLLKKKMGQLIIRSPQKRVTQ